VRKDIVDIVSILSRRHLTTLYSNGWFMTPRLAESLFAAGLTQAGISIDYADSRAHDRRRGIEGATERAWRAVEALRQAAPAGGKQVHVMTVLMEGTTEDFEALLQQSREAEVGHWVTLISDTGLRRGQGAAKPIPGLSQKLARLRARYPHFRVFRDYLRQIDPFLKGAQMPRCAAGRQSFNIDHLGNLSPCIEHIDWSVGNIRTESLKSLLPKVASEGRVQNCEDCWTICRGFAQLLGNCEHMNRTLHL
jgi:radical SAM protein with 4Fe4S-binding SPASM domain